MAHNVRSKNAVCFGYDRSIQWRQNKWSDKRRIRCTSVLNVVKIVIVGATLMIVLRVETLIVIVSMKGWKSKMKMNENFSGQTPIRMKRKRHFYFCYAQAVF